RGCPHTDADLSWPGVLLWMVEYVQDFRPSELTKSNGFHFMELLLAEGWANVHKRAHRRLVSIFTVGSQALPVS
ncbi:hypothetical protein, partial [Pseudomonas aeruginosa]|uniref:hypothetical protein n=1 Tax=Pseudomonas aeruginosa TaxID=287 RepID=UPI003CE75EC6